VLVRRADPAGRLVQQDDLGAQGEGRGDVEKLLVALRQLARERVGLVGEAEERGNLERVGLDLAVAGQREEEARASAEARDDGRLKRLEHRQLGEDLDELEAPRHAEPCERDRPDAADVLALEAHAAPARLEDAGQHVDQRGLAGAVRADDGDEFALADRQAHAVERHVGAVELADVPRLEDHARDTSIGPRRLAKRPMRPPGAKITMKASTAPKMSRQ
jgi:hypothetical protein